MYDKFRRFVTGVSVNWIGRLGVILVTSSFIIFLLLEISRLLGFLTNAYIGLVTYLLFPALFVVGLIFIPIGWRRFQKRTGKSTKELLTERFGDEETRALAGGSRVFRTVLLLTALNILFLGGASFQAAHFMDQPNFCGTACHRVMNPEWTTYQVSSHARVACVECHVGEGVGAAVDAKLNGVWQMISVTFNLYEKPIPTPVRNLRPARETCEKCHWPEKFYGRHMKTIVHYETDENSTPLYTTLNLKIDAGRSATSSGIHWHIAGDNEVRYASVNDERLEMIWVEVREPDGTYRRYENKKLAGSDAFRSSRVRVFDCVDCHNRATHVYEEAGAAIDRRIRAGLIEPSLPFVKRRALRAIIADYAAYGDPADGIANAIGRYYTEHYPEISRKKAARIDSLITVLQAVYARNIHPGMNITWGSYPSHIGHRSREGCGRCHNAELVDSSGHYIDNDCTLCHSILADGQSEPYRYLLPPDSTDRDFPMHEYLRREFLESGAF